MPPASPAAATPPARGEVRRERLIDAAEIVFTRDGLRGASMERIAGEAGVARATVYAYFTDKEDAFRQVSQRLATRLEDAVAQALAAPGPVAERLRAALLAKHEMAFAVARLSPHAADLLAAKDRLAGPLFAASEARVLAMLAADLTAAGVPQAGDAACVLFDAAKGVAAGAPDLDTLRARLIRLADAMVRGFQADKRAVLF